MSSNGRAAVDRTVDQNQGTIAMRSTRTFLRISIALLALLLAACGGGPVRRINPPTANVQQLRVLDAQWELVVRVNNFSTVPMHFESLDTTLEIGGERIPIAGTLDFDIPGQSADIATFRVAAAAHALDVAAKSGLAYRLSGTITTSEPSERFEFERDSKLAPVPGKPGEYR